MPHITRFAVRNNGRVLTDVRRPDSKRSAAKATPVKAKKLEVKVEPKNTVTVKADKSDG